MDKQTEMLILEKIRRLALEINVRRQHGVIGSDYLFYIENKLKDILWEAEKDFHQST